jgi:hypothetical protein
MIEALQKLGVKNLDVQGNLRPTEDLNLLSQLVTAVNKSAANNDDAAQRDADIAVVMNLLARYLANGRTAA